MVVLGLLLCVAGLWFRAAEAAYGYSGHITPENYNEVKMTMCQFDGHEDFSSPLTPSRASTCCVPDKDAKDANTPPESLKPDRFVRNPASVCSATAITEQLTLQSGVLSGILSVEKPQGERP